MIATSDDLIPTSRAAIILQVTDQAVLDMMRRGELPAAVTEQRGNRQFFKFRRADVEALARKRRGEVEA